MRPGGVDEADEQEGAGEVADPGHEGGAYPVLRGRGGVCGVWVMERRSVATGRGAAVTAERRPLPPTQAARPRPLTKKLILRARKAAKQLPTVPVYRSAPVMTTIRSPKGRPMNPNTNFCSPTLLAFTPGMLPPTVSASSAPKAM